jgi:hypothetical protein
MDTCKHFTLKFIREAVQLLESGSRPGSEIAPLRTGYRSQSALQMADRVTLARGGCVSWFWSRQGTHHRDCAAEA